MAKKPTHGGKRKGAGRKKGFRMKKSQKKEPTEVLRVPKTLIPHFKELIKQYNTMLKENAS